MSIKNEITSWENKPTQYNLALATSLKSLFDIYSLDLNEYNRQICCPFPFHLDESPSFVYYPETNSFFCFGCKIGGGPIDFLINFADLSKEEAIEKLLKYQNTDCNIIKLNIQDNLLEKQELLLKFSTYIRQRILKASDEELKQIEHNTFIFDQVYNSHRLSNKALSALIEKIKNKLEI